MVLGSPNDPQGKLSTMALERLEKGLTLFREHPGSRILLTGGWGRHFNISPHPHAVHARAYLEAQGLTREDFLPYTLSRNTREDAELARPILSEIGPAKVIVVTSDFHLERARLIFERTLPRFNLSFQPAPHRERAKRLRELERHERQALEKLKRVSGFDED